MSSMVRGLMINIELTELKLKSDDGELECAPFSFELSDDTPFFCVVGPSGSGKTTFFKSLIPRFVIDWRDYEVVNIKLKIHRNGLDFYDTNGRIGYAAQRPFFVAHRSVRDNLEVPFLWSNKPRPITAEVDSIMRDFCLSELADRKAYNLSAGERQRLNLARMFIAKPELAIIDECFSSLDEDLSTKIGAIIRDKYSKDCRILVSGHRSHDLLPFAPKTLHFSYSDVGVTPISTRRHVQVAVV